MQPTIVCLHRDRILSHLCWNGLQATSARASLTRESQVSLHYMLDGSGCQAEMLSMVHLHVLLARLVTGILRGHLSLSPKLFIALSSGARSSAKTETCTPHDEFRILRR